MAKNLNQFQKYIKQERKRHFPKADELVLRAMKNLGLDKKKENYQKYKRKLLCRE